MILWIALGCLALGLLIGGAGMRKAGRLAGRTWRPGVGMLALVCFVGAAVLGVREAFGPALVLFLIGLMLSMSVRRTQRQRPTGRSGAQSPPPLRPRRGSMSLEEARGILGVASSATPEEVQAAYLRLIRRAHPDQGGTSGLAAQLNAARDVLLGKR